MTIARLVFEALRNNDIKLVTAESCTGGLVAAAMTDIAGSSQIFDRGFVTYSNEAKTECLAVPFDMLQQHGAVSAHVAMAMAEGALLHSKADIAIAITGIAGPEGGTIEKPVGLVFFGLACKNKKTNYSKQEFGIYSRSKIRNLAKKFALQMVLDQLTTKP